MRTTVPAKSLQKAPPPDLRSMVLVIDKSEDLCFALKQLLELDGVTVVARSSGASGLRELQAGRRFGLILLDVNLRDMSGAEILAELKSLDLVDQQPILGVTDVYDDELKNLPLTGIVRKPIDLMDLTAKVRQFLTLH